MTGQRPQLELWFDLPPAIVGGNGRGRWEPKHHAFQAYKSRAESVIRELFQNAQRWPIERPFYPQARISFDWRCPNQGHWPDVDNYIARCKPAIDAIVAAGLIADDGPAYLRLGEVTYSKGTKRLTVVLAEDTV